MKNAFLVLRQRVGWVVVLAALVLAGCVSAPVLDGPRRLEAQGRWVEALRAYEQIALGVTGAGRAQVEQEIARVRRTITEQNLAEIAKKRGEPATLRSLEAALARAEEAAAYDDAQGRIAAERTRLRARQAELTRTYDALLVEAERAVTSGDWAAALDRWSAAEVLAGDAPELRGRIADGRQKRDVALAVRVRAAVSARDLAGAEKALVAAAAWRLKLAGEMATELEVEVEGLRRVLFIEAQRALVAERRYFEAYRNLGDADYSAAQELLAEVRAAGAAHYLAEARRERETDASRIGFAYLAAVKAKEMAGERDDVFTTHRDLADEIDAFITLRVAVAGFDSPADMPGLGGQVADALITYLIDHLPYGVKVIERAQTDRVMRGADGELAQLGQRLDADIVVVGNVSSLNVERKRAEREVTEVVQVGVRKEPNPLYAQMAAKHGANAAAWPFAVPAMIDGGPILETIRYKQGEEVLNAVMVAYVRSFEAARATVTQSREFSATENIKDGYRDAVRAAGIEYDPLELPTDNEVRERLRARLVAEVAAEVLKRYTDREQRYLKDAEAALLRREADLAALNLAAAHHYSTVAAAAIKGGRTHPAVARIDRMALFELTR